MHLPHAADLDESFDVAVANAAPGHHDNSIVGLLHHAADQGAAVVGGRLLARGQDPVDSKVAQGLEPFGCVAAHVEGAVAGDGFARREVDKLGHAPVVDAAVLGQGADDESGGAGLQEGLEVARHDIDFGRVIEEVACSRPHHGEDRDLGRGANGLAEARARGQASFGEAGAQFDAFCATDNGGVGPGDRFDADFNQNGWIGLFRHWQYGAHMRAQLLHLSGPLRGRTVTYPERLVRIGRDTDNEVSLQSSSVADRHAILDWVEAECQFHLRSLDGDVFVNGRQVEEIILKDGDQLEFGAGGPMARFHTYVPIGAVCKPVRRMLKDARAVAKHSGGATATRMLTKDLFTQATPTLKIGFPLMVVGAAFLVGWFGGWLGSRPSPAEQQRTADMVTKAEVDEMRAEYQAQIQSLAKPTAVIRRVQKEWSLGVCLIHGVYGLAHPDGTPALDRRGDVIEVEYTGSGFLVSDQGHIVTNRHVALPWTEDEDHMERIANGMRPVFTRLTTTFPGKMPIAVAQESIKRRSDALDVAVMQLAAEEVKGIPVLPLRSDGTEGEDQRAILVGYPTGLAALLARANKDTLQELRRTAASMSDAISQLAKAGQIKPVITQGIVSNSESHLIAYDAGTTSGGSGGPVFSGKGDVIAVNFAIQRNFAGNNLGVPIRYALELLEKK